jgi:hypothetical protein
VVTVEALPVGLEGLAAVDDFVVVAQTGGHDGGRERGAVGDVENLFGSLWRRNNGKQKDMDRRHIKPKIQWTEINNTTPPWTEGRKADAQAKRDKQNKRKSAF